jgi:ribosomal protein L12E/L44/L45/RPP1/RPP2
VGRELRTQVATDNYSTRRAIVPKKQKKSKSAALRKKRKKEKKEKKREKQYEQGLFLVFDARYPV